MKVLSPQLVYDPNSSSDRRVAWVAEVNQPAYDCKVALVADIVEPTKGEFYLMIGLGDHTCERWRLTEDLARKLRKGLNAKLD